MPMAHRPSPIASNLTSRLLPLVLIASAAFFGCKAESSKTGEVDRSTSPLTSSKSSGSPQSNRPPSVRSAKITPNPVLLGWSVLVQVEAEDPDGDPVTLRRQWLANGKPIEGETGPALVPRMLKRGDLLAVEVTPLDGKAAGTPYQTDAVPVGNTPPAATRVVLEPAQVQVGGRLQAQVEGTDADQDSIRYTFKWWRNNLPVSEGEEGVVETTGFARGDTIVVQATPHDAAGPGKPKFSDPLMISNSPPKITSVPPTAIDRGRYEYAVAAVDPDNDPLTYLLQTAPPGMMIDKATGLIEWRITPNTKGTHRVRVSVEDGQEGRAFQEFDLTPP